MKGRTVLGQITNQAEFPVSPGINALKNTNLSSQIPSSNDKRKKSDASIFSPSNPSRRSTRNSLEGIPANLLDDDDDDEQDDTENIDTNNGQTKTKTKNNPKQTKNTTRRVTASPSQIALFSSLLNNSGDSNNDEINDSTPKGFDDENKKNSLNSTEYFSFSKVGNAPAVPLTVPHHPNTTVTTSASNTTMITNTLPLTTDMLMNDNNQLMDDSLFNFLGTDNPSSHHYNDHRSSLMYTNRRQSLLSPSMAALFDGNSSNTSNTRNSSSGSKNKRQSLVSSIEDKENSTGSDDFLTELSATNTSRTSNNDSRNGYTTISEVSSEDANTMDIQKAVEATLGVIASIDAATSTNTDTSDKDSSSFTENSTTHTTNANTLLNTSSLRTGPAHRVKTPARSCLTGKGMNTDGSLTGGSLKSVTDTSRRTGGRRTVIFGSPQAAEYHTDAAPAESITAMEKSAAKARYRLGDEPELPFPSLDGPVANHRSTTSTVISGTPVTTVPTATVTPLATTLASTNDNVPMDDDSSSVESVETSNNSALLKEWEEEASHLESSVSRNKRARDAARSRARDSISSSEKITTQITSGNILPESTVPEIMSPSSAVSKRSRRSSTNGRSPSMERIAHEEAVVTATTTAGTKKSTILIFDDNVENSNTYNDEEDLPVLSEPTNTSLHSIIPAPPTPMRRSKRLSEGSGMNTSGSLSSMNTNDTPNSQMNISMDGPSTPSRGTTPAMDIASLRRSPRVARLTPSQTLPEVNTNGNDNNGNGIMSALDLSPITGGGTDSTMMFSSSLVQPTIAMNRMTSTPLPAAESLALQKVAQVKVAPVISSVSPGPNVTKNTHGAANNNKRRVTLAVVPGSKKANKEASTTLIISKDIPENGNDEIDEAQEESVDMEQSIILSSVAVPVPPSSIASTRSVVQSYASPYVDTNDSHPQASSRLSLNSMDRTADTAQRDALMALLDDDTTSSSFIIPTKSNARSTSTTTTTTSTTRNIVTKDTANDRTPGDLTMMLNTDSGTRTVVSSTKKGKAGILTAGGFGVQNLLNSSNTEMFASTGNSMGESMVMDDKTVALPASLGQMLNMEESAIGLPRSSMTDMSLNLTGVGQGMGLADDDNDHTYASIDGVPRYDQRDDEMGEVSIVPHSPEKSFVQTFPTSVGGHRNPPIYTGADGSILYNQSSLSMSMDHTANEHNDSDVSTHSRDSVDTADVVDREIRLLEEAGLTPNRQTHLAVTRSANKPVPSTTATTAHKPPVIPSVHPNAPVTSTVMANIATTLSTMQNPHNNSFLPRSPEVITVPIAGASIGTPGRSLMMNNMSQRKATPQASLPVLSVPVPTASLVPIPASGTFEDFCTMAGIRFFTGSEGLSESFLHPSLPVQSVPKESSQPINRRISILSHGTMNTAKPPKDRRRSSIAIMARKSILGRRESLINPTSEAAIASNLVTQMVLQQERAQIENATEIMREQVRQAAPTIATYTAEIDRSQPAVLKEIIQANNIIAAYDLEGKDCGYTDEQIAHAEDLLTKLRDLRTTHEMNAKVIYLNWRADMAKQRTQALQVTHTAFTQQLTELQGLDTKIQETIEQVYAMTKHLGQERDNHEILSTIHEPLMDMIDQNTKLAQQVNDLASNIGPLEAEVITLQSRKAALEARIRAEQETMEEMEAENALYSSSSNEPSDKYITLATQAMDNYENLCTSSGWKITAMDNSGPSTVVSLGYTHPDTSMHTLTVNFMNEKTVPTYTSFTFTPASSTNVKKGWESGNILAFYHAAAVCMAKLVTDRSSTMDTPLLMEKFTTSMKTITNVCEEMITLRSWYPARFVQDNDNWSIAVDMSTPIKSSSPVKIRLNFTLLSSTNTSQDFTYPQNYLGCHITKLYGNDTIINVISTTLETIQSNFGKCNNTNGKFAKSRILSMVNGVQQILKQ